MVKLYTWSPTTPATVLEHTVAPDVGHSALEVIGADGATRAYASFWPERDSLIGRITGIWKHRPTRYPDSYATEIDPAGAYMQREAEYVDVFEGLEEDTIVHLWAKLKKTEYDFLKWNCSNVCKLLLLSSVHPGVRPTLEQALQTSPEDLKHAAGAGDLLATLAHLSASSFIECSPVDLRRLSEAYAAAHHAFGASRSGGG
ncbi:hypothetical protein CCAX7_16260 [Capsulimonas corticalis]|uniref:Uncharacterized protein n=1 Tax=Capsulimonas corticalis TaxID=2219043 RepID=A0A402CYZ7_9BACT|nr:hypothetical protein [Capsulimonas corticalis]BDI29575.1 hypothetical protein CCAX7_16260 [Capsulimonas corticalis]